MNVEFSDGHETYLSAGGGVWARYILDSRGGNKITRNQKVFTHKNLRIYNSTCYLT